MCEKPFTTDIKSAKYFVDEYKKAGILLAVNYTRRWNKTFIELKNKIKRNEYGKILNIVGFYNKGILLYAQKGYLQTRKSGCLQYKTFILRGLRKKPSKRQQNDFTTKIRRTRRKR